MNTTSSQQASPELHFCCDFGDSAGEDGAFQQALLYSVSTASRIRRPQQPTTASLRLVTMGVSTSVNESQDASISSYYGIPDSHAAEETIAKRGYSVSSTNIKKPPTLFPSVLRLPSIPDYQKFITSQRSGWPKHEKYSAVNFPAMHKTESLMVTLASAIPGGISIQVLSQRHLPSSNGRSSRSERLR